MMKAGGGWVGGGGGEWHKLERRTVTFVPTLGSNEQEVLADVFAAFLHLKTSKRLAQRRICLA